jgi:alpha-amylase/alpha-mannosidase (GH57 family)
MNKYICIHGHFYQPPRENAWLEYVEQQDSAYPFHDWNDRITTECYAPNMASRILAPDGQIIDIVNNYSQISFNFGPTLLSWLELHRPEVYNAIIEADKLSMERYAGHGSAIAQVYNHMIMPLANTRDKITQVRWGVRDFEKRFGRRPEGMWLPETAVDTESLEVLAAEDITFTILAPHQAHRVRKMSRNARWQDVSGGRVNPTIPYLCRLPSGKSINLFFYDGPISQDIAFGGLLYNGENFAKRLISGLNKDNEAQLVHISTDGETYGHHHRHGEMALTYCLYYIQQREDVHTTIYPAYLSKYPPTHEVEIVENSSWSCIHGIGRWKENCGCHSGMHHGWNQEWRKPLRDALDWLRDEMIPYYEHRMSQYVSDPWKTRDEYIDVILHRSRETVDNFLRRHTGRTLTKDDKQIMLKLLELQRNAMLMYTSCGWFFDEISGIETTQIMQYAARVIQIAEHNSKNEFEEEFLKRIEKAPSNVFTNGREAYDKFVKPTRVDLLRVGAHYAVTSLFEKYPDSAPIYCYTADSESAERLEAGKLKLSMGKAHITSELTLADTTVEYVAVHLGDHNIYGGVKEYAGNGQFDEVTDNMRTAFDKADIPEVIRIMEKYFGSHSYSMWHLFKDDQRKILDKSQILKQPLQTAETFYKQIYENNYTTLTYVRELNIPIPKPLALAIEYTINTEMQKVFDGPDMDIEKLESLIKETKKWNIDLDTTMIGLKVSSWVNKSITALDEKPEDVDLLDLVERVVGMLRGLNGAWDFWQAQNVYYRIGKSTCAIMHKRKKAGDEGAERWMTLYNKLGDHFNVKITW